MISTRTRRLATAATALAVLAAGCGNDDGAGVRTIGGDGASVSGSASGTGTHSGSASGTGVHSGSASGTGAHTGSATGTGTAADQGAAVALGGFTPVSDVSSHARITLDVCEIAELLPKDATPEYDAVATIYTEGSNSETSDGFRTLADNATAQRDEPLWDLYEQRFGPAWIDGFVTAAIEGTGPFEGEPDSVRRQGIEKGLQNQDLVLWAFHELDAARAKVEAGETDPAEGAPHNVDEIWAFYHGVEPGCAPYATASKRGADFGTGEAVNDAVLAATEDLQQAALDGDLGAFDAAYDQLVSAVTVTYVQAAIKYAQVVGDDLAAGDADAARTHQAEGWAFFRVIEPLVADVDAAVADEVAAVFDLANDPQQDGGDVVREALSSVYEGLGITAEQVGEFQG